VTSTRHQPGFTLIELIMFIVIVSVGLTGVLLAFSTTVKSSADPMILKQALRIAEGAMQEVLQKEYQNDPTGDNAATPALGCTPTTTPTCVLNTPADRANYNDVDDYSGFSQTGIKQLDGTTAVSGLEAYTMSISVDATTATLGSLAAPNVKKITVTVSGSNQTISLVGYRTKYGY
jgi:MSHA pilin protein MshD